MSATVYDSLAPVSTPTSRIEASLAGQTLANRFDVLELLGRGGMGAVYRARDRDLDEIVALKIVRRELADVPSMVERFRHEVKLARRVTHINVARTFELGSSDGLVFCTMELIDGQSLAQRLERGPIVVDEAVAIACAVCDGLAAAHAAGVVHRDIKPDNILLASDGRVVLADFGVAAATVAVTGELSGTLAYMAPEQERGEPASPASDVYSLAVVLDEMIGHAAAPELAAVISHARMAAVADRIGSANAFRRALQPWTSATPRTTQSFRVPQTLDNIASVVVLAPYRNGHEDRQYLATAVHESLLVRLAKIRQLRVLPRVGASTDQPTFGIEINLQDQLEVWISQVDGAAIHLTFPTGMEQVASTTEAVASAIEAGLARVQRPDPNLNAALDLFWRARHMAYRDLMRVPEAIVMLLQARELAPQEPRIAATLAVANIRQAFFRPAENPTALTEARLLATAAVTAAPDLPDGHIALGHLELTDGNPVRAASHFRMAISRAPHLAEAHEQLGRMLLEAGYLDLARARLDEALSIAPDLRSAQWEVTRALALDGKWDEVDAMVAELVALGIDRPMSRARYAWWRRDVPLLTQLRGQIAFMDRVLWPGVVDALLDTFLDKQMWHVHRAKLFEALYIEIPNRRRRVFLAQLTCEAAAYAEDLPAVLELLEHATVNGLYDLHWMDKCVMLDGCRTAPAFVAARTRIADRSVAILDALYGDHAVALSETQVA